MVKQKNSNKIQIPVNLCNLELILMDSVDEFGRRLVAKLVGERINQLMEEWEKVRCKGDS